MDDAVRIALEAGLPFTGLRNFTVDPRLWRYVPLAYAAEHRLVPVMLAGDVLHVACTAPDADVSAVRRWFPGLDLALHIAAGREIDAVLARTQ